MNRKFLRPVLFISLLTMVLNACKVTAPYQSPASNTAGLFRDVNTTDTNSIATLPWNQVFTDTILQRLISTGLAQNLNLKVAVSRIEQAQSYYAQSSAAYYPTLSGNAQATVAKISTSQ